MKRKMPTGTEKGRAHTPNGRPTCCLGICTDQRPARKLPREGIEEGEDLHLLLTPRRSRPKLKTFGFGSPIQGEPRPIGSIKEKGHRLGPNDDLDKPFLKPLI